MEITISELLKGKATKIKNNNFFPTEAYVEPFLERMSKFTNDFRVQVKLPDQITRTVDGEINMDDITYNRVWIQAVMPDEYCFDNHQEVLGLVYGLDVRKPLYKIYRGGLNMACTNLCIFNPSFLDVQELEPEHPINFKGINRLMEQTDEMKVWLERLHNTEIPYNEEVINENVGRWLRNIIEASYDNGLGKVKLATSNVVDVYKSLYVKKDSPYFVPKGEATDLFNVYNAFTQLITDDSKDIINKPEKTLLLKQILNL